MINADFVPKKDDIDPKCAYVSTHSVFLQINCLIPTPEHQDGIEIRSIKMGIKSVLDSLLFLNESKADLVPEFYWVPHFMSLFTC